MYTKKDSRGNSFKETTWMTEERGTSSKPDGKKTTGKSCIIGLS